MKGILNLLFLFASVLIYAQNGKLSGKIVSAVDNFPTPGVTIKFLIDEKVEFITGTDIDGNYSIEKIPFGTYYITFNSLGNKEKIVVNFKIEEETKIFNFLYPDICIASEKVCPKGHDDKLIPIVYGLPGKKLLKKAEKGKVKLGGCVVSDCNPKWFCKTHDLEF